MKMKNVVKNIQKIAMFLLSFVAMGSLTNAQQPVADVQKPAEVTRAEVNVGNFTAVDTGDIKVKKLAVGDVDEVWVASEGGKIYQLTSQGWQFRTMGIDVGVAEDGTVVVINEKNDVVKRNEEGEWTPIADFKLSSIAVGCADGMWGVYKEGDNVSVYHFDDGKWEKVKNILGQDAKGLVYFSVNAEEVVYAIDDKGNIYHRDLDRVALVEKTKDLREKITRDQKTKPAAKSAMAPQAKAMAQSAVAVAQQPQKTGAAKAPIKKTVAKKTTTRKPAAKPVRNVKGKVAAEAKAPAAEVKTPVVEVKTLPAEVMAPVVAEKPSVAEKAAVVEPVKVSTAAPMD